MHVHFLKHYRFEYYSVCQQLARVMDTLLIYSHRKVLLAFVLFTTAVVFVTVINLNTSAYIPVQNSIRSTKRILFHVAKPSTDMVNTTITRMLTYTANQPSLKRTIAPSISSTIRNSTSISPVRKSNRTYLVTWFKVPFYIKAIPEALNRTFDTCEYNNCILSRDSKYYETSDAIMWKGRELPDFKTIFKRPVGQVWIFAEDEAPITYHYGGNRWTLPEYRGAFNWTMTYDRVNTDIYLPYGEFEEKERTITRDYISIAKSKTKDAIIITSHCDTQSQRLKYIDILKKYISVDILGSCGQKWNCGEQWVHDKCFNILNSTYRYYLAFENAICRGYRTEKLFRNYKYDIIIVTRGDMSNFKSVSNEPLGAYISTEDFTSIEQLGKYLRSVSDSPDKYAKLLERKNKYISVPYERIYQRSLCDICKRMNFQDKYHKEIQDLRPWRDLDHVCLAPTDIL